jgi:S1-C subfamily serine protease
MRQISRAGRARSWRAPIPLAGGARNTEDIMEDFLHGYLPEHPADPRGAATSGGNPPRRPGKRWGIALALTGILAVGLAGCSGDASATSTGSTVIGANTQSQVSVPASATDLQQTVINVVSTVEPSVVQIQGSTGQGQVIGSGDIISSDGYIVTNDHVVSGASNFTVLLSNSTKLSATVKGEAPDNDLAVLKVNTTGLHPIGFADSSKVQVGQFSIAVGSPLGLAQSATFGIVSALDRTASEGSGGPASQLTGLIQTSAPINNGNSGGALVDLTGKLIGIPTLGAINQETGSAADGIGFAIPSNTVNTISQQIIKSGSIASKGHGFLGIQPEDVTPALAQAYNLPTSHGVLIVGYGQDTDGVSPAQQAGLQVGDIIVKLNNTTINNSNDLEDFLLQQSPGAKISVSFYHANGGQATVTVTLGTRPSTNG